MKDYRDKDLADSFSVIMADRYWETSVKISSEQDKTKLITLDILEGIFNTVVKNLPPKY